DGAESEHALGLPAGSILTVYQSPRPLESVAMFNSRLHYPAGAVLAKTVSLKGRRIETQVLHFDGRQWRAYSYVWNEAQTDSLRQHRTRRIMQPTVEHRHTLKGTR
ncbi:MAG: hypothetical protein ACKPJD_21245, partial [Planctomycetaceae bacterium]